MISEAREKYWNFVRYEDGPSLKERRPILYELEKQLGSSVNTTRIIGVLLRRGFYSCDIATMDDLKEAVKTIENYRGPYTKGISQENLELVKMFIEMYEAA
jgi:hypothetical protein